VYIDGVGQKGYVRSGLAGQSDQTQGNPFPQLAIGEYKVITSNYKAEYDQISSAAVTAETRSGTTTSRARSSACTAAITSGPKHPESSTRSPTSRRLPRIRSSDWPLVDRSSRT